MSTRMPCRGRLLGVVAATFVLLVSQASAQQQFLAKGGQAEAVIVVGHEGDNFDHWVAGELQRYVEQLSGAELSIVSSDRIPPQKLLIVVGSPESNPLVASAEEKELVSFAGLKPGGLVLKTVDLEGRPAVLVGAGDETGTMYAAYELLERLGIVFQLSNDIIPQQKPDLPLPSLDVRMEPAFKDRGMFCWHQIRWYMGLKELRQEIDQLAKLKMNVFQFYWGIGGPWAEFSYDGKKAEIFGIKESGFVAWASDVVTWGRSSGTADSVIVGRECFREDGYMGPPEFANVQTQEEAYRTAREFLREVIRYAHSRKVQVWLAMGETPYVPPNLIPPESKKFRSFYCGTAIPHGDPAMLDIWEAAVQSMIESYPEADRYCVVSGPEHLFEADLPQTQALIRDYDHLRPLLPQKSKADSDIDLADVAVADKLIRRIKDRYPETKLGVQLIFRGGQLRPLDAVLPKDVALMNMVNFRRPPSEYEMDYFDGIQGRDLLVWPRITDDGCDLHMQLNATLYDERDNTIRDAVRYGLTGVLGQLHKSRGAEQSAQYIAEGAWNPDISAQSFYQRYLRRLYGSDALDLMLKAFLLLEANEREMGWDVRRVGVLLNIWKAGSNFAYLLRKVDYQAEKLELDRQEVEKAIEVAEQRREFWDDRVADCRQALGLLQQARPKVLPGSLDELDYVTYKTENFATALEVLSAAEDAKIAFDGALLAMSDGKADEVDKQLEQTQTAVDRADRLVREAAEQMIPFAHIPTERHILWVFNNGFPFHERARAYLAEVVAFRKAETQGEKP